MYYELVECMRLPWEKTWLPLMLQRKINEIIKMMKNMDLIGMSISRHFQFHLQGIDDSDEAWEKLEAVFGKNNEIQVHQLEN
jgi:hypothetical protein